MKASLLAAMAALLSARAPREETEGGFTFRLRNRAPAPTPTGPAVIVPRRQIPGAKGGPGEMGRRERQRREWRGRVSAAAATWARADAELRTVSRPPWTFGGDYLPALDRRIVAEVALDAALAAPKPWRKVRET